MTASTKTAPVLPAYEAHIPEWESPDRSSMSPISVTIPEKPPLLADEFTPAQVYLLPHEASLCCETHGHDTSLRLGQIIFLGFAFPYSMIWLAARKTTRCRRCCERVELPHGGCPCKVFSGRKGKADMGQKPAGVVTVKPVYV